MRKKVLVLGANFGGLTAALAVQHELHGDVDVTVVSASDRFLFNPCLIWLPFGKRDREDITFPVAPTFEHARHRLRPRRGHRGRPGREEGHHRGRRVLDYDYLVIATGYRNDDDVGARAQARTPYTITTLADAERAGRGWRRFLEQPGRRRRRRDPGRRLLRCGLRVPVQHLLPAAQGRPAQAGQADLRDRRAVPRALRHRRAAARRAAAGHVPARRRASSPASSTSPSTTSTTARWCSPTASRPAVRLRHGRPAVPRPGRSSAGRRAGRRQGLRHGPRHLPEREVRRRLRGRHRRRRRGALADADAGRHPQDRLPDRADGPRRGHATSPPRSAASRPRTPRRSATSRPSASWTPATTA